MQSGNVPLRFLNGGRTSKGCVSEREGDVSGHWAWTEEIVYILVLVEIRRIEVSIFLFLMG
jgi:hypothetical protein